MPPILSIFFDVCLPILVAIALGWGLDRIFGFDLKTLVKLNIYLFVPAFILVRLSTSPLPTHEGVIVVLFTAGVIASMGAASWIVALVRRDPPERRASLQLATMIYNCGNWGIPLMTLAFGEMGGVVQVFVLATMNLTTFSVGVFLANSGNPNRRGWLLPMLRQPSPYALLLALAIRAWGNPFLEVAAIWTPLTMLADGLVGVALITLGVQLSQTNSPVPRGDLATALIIRLLGGPLIAMGFTWVAGLQGDLAAILIIGAAAPTAVNTALLAHEFGADSKFAAAAVLYSTIGSVLVITTLLALLHAGAFFWLGPVSGAPSP
jgi:hypothetical protein